MIIAPVLQLAGILGAALNESLTHPKLKAGGAWEKRCSTHSDKTAESACLAKLQQRQSLEICLRPAEFVLPWATEALLRRWLVPAVIPQQAAVGQLAA